MDTMLVAVFDSEAKAREALRALEALGEAGTITLNADATVTKSAGGAIDVGAAEQPMPEAMLGGSAIGALVDMLGGPGGLAVGAATGLALGATADVFTSKVERDVLAHVERALEPGKSAVVAQIYEEETAPVNERMAALGGLVFRRELTDVADENNQKHVDAIKRRLQGRHHV